MSAAFTPGPWVAQEYEPGGGSGFVRIGDIVVDGIYRGGDSDRLRIEDARLIAASPDLLNELINLTARFKAAIVRAGTDEEFAEQAVASARAAIAKALPVTTKDAEVSNG